jgi:hypothetical protein
MREACFLAFDAASLHSKGQSIASLRFRTSLYGTSRKREVIVGVTAGAGKTL